MLLINFTEDTSPLTFERLTIRERDRERKRERLGQN